jgi:hypothetical protein
MKKRLVIILLCGYVNGIYAQTTSRIINTAVPFLEVPVTAQGLAMGNTGAGMSMDDNTIFYNPAKIVFQKNVDVFSASYIPWMREFSNDMKLVNVNYSYKKDMYQAFQVGLTYFNMGRLMIKDDNGSELGNYKSNEFALTGTYSRALNYSTAIALTFRGIYSGILRTSGYPVPTVKNAWGLSADLSLFKTIELDYSRNLHFGFNLSNIGPKMHYGQANDIKTSLPTNLRIGAGYDNQLNDDNGFSVGMDINKLLVPSPPVYDQSGQVIKGKNPDRSYLNALFSSLYDAPGGFKEELQEINVCAGGEYRYMDVLAFRAGVSYESKAKGNRSYVGAGVEYKFALYDQRFSINACYLTPFSAQSPLKNTFGITVYIRLGDSEE